MLRGGRQGDGASPLRRNGSLLALMEAFERRQVFEIFWTADELGEGHPEADFENLTTRARGDSRSCWGTSLRDGLLVDPDARLPRRRMFCMAARVGCEVLPDHRLLSQSHGHHSRTPRLARHPERDERK